MRTISATPSRRRSSSRRFRLSRSLFPFSSILSCSSPLPRSHSSLARSSGKGWSRLRHDFRLFFLFTPHLPPLPPPPQRSSSFGIRTLFVVSPLLFVLLQLARFINAVLCLLHEHAHSSIHTHTHTQKHPLCVSLAPTIFHDPSSPFLNPACVLLSRSSSFANLLSHPCPENPPFPTYRISLQERPASAIHAADSPPLLFYRG